MEIKSSYIAVGLAVLASFGGGWLLCGQVNKEKIELGERFAAFRTIEKYLPEGYEYEIKSEGMALEDCVNAYYSNNGDEYFNYSFDGSVTYREDLLNTSHLLKDGGFEISANAEGTMTVSSIDEDSYAEQQGLRLGDVITKIDGHDIKEETFAIAGKYFLGENGSTAKLTILRGDETIELDYVRKYVIENDPHPRMIENDICYIPFRVRFSDVNYSVFERAFEEYDDSAEGYIIDLRENGGGDTATSLKILGYFLGEREIGKQVYYDGSEEILSSGSDGKLCDKKVVLLVNENTASASEIFTAAMMQYYDNVEVVGTKTFGKGIFQVQTFLEGEDVLRYTAGYYTVGEWDCYQGVGIEPDIAVKMDEELIETENDIQLAKAIELLK